MFYGRRKLNNSYCALKCKPIKGLSSVFMDILSSLNDKSAAHPENDLKLI